MCILLTLVAIGAQANDSALPQPEPTINSAASKSSPVQDLIKKQLEAIKDRDAELAWSMTTGSFHEKFETGKEFLSHLRLKLRPVYNHEGFTFLDQHDIQNGLVQKVEMEDRYGDPATVIYRLKQQDNGEWLIDSFAILESEAEPI